jgi:hypothetical protein
MSVLDLDRPLTVPNDVQRDPPNTAVDFLRRSPPSLNIEPTGKDNTIMSTPWSKKPIIAALAVVATLSSLGGVASAGVEGGERVNLYTSNFEMQNFFFTGEALIPFFEPQSGQINQGIEIRQSDNYIYSFNFTRSTIIMRWNQSPEFDFYEPYVAAAAGLTQEEAAASPFEDRYVITFDEPISGYEIAASESMPLVPEVRVLDDYTLEIAIPAGTAIGDGKNAVIAFRAAG